MTTNQIILLIVIDMLLTGIFCLYAHMVFIWRDSMMKQAKQWKIDSEKLQEILKSKTTQNE